MNWTIKAITQKVISILPFSNQINFLFQRYLTVGKDLPASFLVDRINHANTHLESFMKLSPIPIEQVSILEIGTGWYPIVPIVCFLSGSNDIVTADIRKLYSRQSVNQTIRAFLTLYYNNSLVELIPTIQLNRVAVLELALKEKNVSKKLKLLQISTTLCKHNNYTIGSGSKDLIISNNTFQCVKKDQLNKLLSEVCRMGKPNSVMCVAIDLTDEFSHFDRSISNYNFLKFSETQWRLISNRLNSPNRLRYSDYQKRISLHFRIVNENLIQGEAQELECIQVHKMFSGYPISDLLVKHVYFVCLNNNTALI